MLAGAGYTNVTRLTKALDGAALREALHGVHLLGIRSRTQSDEAAFAAADRSLAVGCFPRRHQPGRSAAPRAAAAFRCSTRRSPTPAASPSW